MYIKCDYLEIGEVSCSYKGVLHTVQIENEYSNLPRSGVYLRYYPRMLAIHYIPTVYPIRTLLTPKVKQMFQILDNLLRRSVVST